MRFISTWSLSRACCLADLLGDQSEKDRTPYGQHLHHQVAVVARMDNRVM